jgi:hypothetical protein
MRYAELGNYFDSVDHWGDKVVDDHEQNGFVSETLASYRSRANSYSPRFGEYVRSLADKYAIGENMAEKDKPDEPTTDYLRSCVRCAHYRRGELDAAGTHLCERPQLGSRLDRVLGAEVPNTRDAYMERRNIAVLVEKGVELLTNEPDPGFCGAEGKFFQRSGF